MSIVPILKDKNKKGKDVARLSAKDRFNPKELKTLLSEYADAMNKWGLDRGMDSHLTGAKHQDTKQFYKELPKKINEKREEVEKLQEKVKELKKEARVDSAWKTVTGVVDAIGKRKEIDLKEAQISTLNRKVDELGEEVAKIKTGAENQLKYILNETQDLARAHDKLKTINQKLESENKELKKENKRLQEKINDLISKSNEKVIETVKSVLACY